MSARAVSAGDAAAGRRRLETLVLVGHSFAPHAGAVGFVPLVLPERSERRTLSSAAAFTPPARTIC